MEKIALELAERNKRSDLKKVPKFPEHLKKWEWLPIGAKDAVLCEDGVWRYRIFHFGKWRVYSFQSFVKHPDNGEHCALEMLSDENQKNAMDEIHKNFKNACTNLLTFNLRNLENQEEQNGK